MAVRIADAAARHNVSKRRMQRLVQDGRVPGAQMVANAWMLPDLFVITAPPKRKRRPDKITTE